jgi:hypothetical protein
MLILWETIQTDQPLELAETKSLRFDRTYMRPIREEVDSIFELSPIRTANLWGYLKFSPPNTNRIARPGDKEDIHNGNFSRVATASSVRLCASVADDELSRNGRLKSFVHCPARLVKGHPIEHGLLL